MLITAFHRDEIAARCVWMADRCRFCSSTLVKTTGYSKDCNRVDEVRGDQVGIHCSEGRGVHVAVRATRSSAKGVRDIRTRLVTGANGSRGRGSTFRRIPLTTRGVATRLTGGAIARRPDAAVGVAVPASLRAICYGARQLRIRVVAVESIATPHLRGSSVACER